ncbi:HAMP domain-containing histidine kinase [Mycobacterium sp. KBS0706]|uniref:sensor histidine kinase n=1 Tax=Mycobacterium sp. KBS0706 TaxID=2578109 RepID=UPI00110FEC11|nr:HAMP domain-containing sensor histidine kinase [Mycobacterium sp. KBS0706]TSD86885.1 HAMP domain-containing histidine kinase [Mycobacterium sp. KBS0706]
MHLIRVLRSSTFRYAIIYMLVFGASVAGVMGFVYWQTVRVIASQTDDTIQAEITGLAEQYRQSALLGLIRIIRERSQAAPGRRGLYLLADRNYNRIEGNLSSWPPIARGAPNTVDFLVATDVGEDARPQVARARTVDVPGGFHLLVGRDMTERTDFTKLMTDALIGGLILTAVLGIAGGILMSRSLLARIEGINRGTEDILQGDLTRRMPVRGNRDEFDRLATSLNAMLDQIDGLMTGMRGVADNIAHDLRSPISRLRSRLEVSLMGETDADGYRRAMEDAIREADGILATFNALLEIALAEAGAVRDRFSPIDLSALAADAGDLYGPVAEDKGQALAAAIEPGVTVPGNSHLLAQAVANLLDNAIKYTPEGGRISLDVRRDGDGAVLDIRDTGPGIPEEARGRVLERFVRLDASRSAPGAGLGLSLVSAVARLHRATLALTDNAPGLHVTMRFPQVLAPANGAAETHPA